MIIEFHDDYEKISRKEVKDERVFSVVKRKFDLLKFQGIRYPSLRAKKLQNINHEKEELWEFYIIKKWRCFFTYNEEEDRIIVIKISNHL